MNKNKRWVDVGLLAFVFYLCSAAAFSGFFAKWALRDGDTQYDAIAILDGKAVKPFAYRYLVPAAANALDRSLPPALHDKVSDALMKMNLIGRQFAQATQSNLREYILRYHFIYAIIFACALTTLFALRRLALDLTSCPITANITPPLFMLTLTLLETGGGYYYDYVELLCMVVSVLLARSGRYLLLGGVVTLAVLNKESFLFFALSLFPLFPASSPRARRVAWAGAYAAICVAANVAIKLLFKDNEGGMVEVHLLDNLRAFVSLSTYFHMEKSYGVLFPQGFHIVNLALFCVIARRGWSRVPVDIRRHLLLAALFNIPLFIAFAVVNELRNLSFLYVGLFAVLCGSVREWVVTAGSARPAIGAPT